MGRILRYRASNLPQLSNQPPFDVVDRAVREQKTRGGLALNTRNALAVARTTGQDLAVVGMVKRTGTRYQVRGYIYDASTGIEIGRPIILNAAESDVPRLEARLSAAILGGIGLPLTARQRGELHKPLTTHYQTIKLLGDYLLAGPRVASSSLRDLNTNDPTFPLGAVEKADRLLQTGRYWDALTAARDWNARMPSNRDFASCKFGALLGTGRISEASAVLNGMEASYPSSFSVAMLKYWLMRLGGNEQGALAATGRLRALNPLSSEAYGCCSSTALRLAFRIDSGAIQSQAGAARAYTDYIQIARASAERAVNLDSKYEDMWLTLMIAYREQGNIDGSSQAFRQLTALDPKNCDALSNQALNYLCENDPRSAGKLWSSCFSTDRKRADALMGLALCAKMSGKTALAGGHFRRAAAMDKRCADAAYLRREKHWPVQFAKTVAALGSTAR